MYITAVFLLYQVSIRAAKPIFWNAVHYALLQSATISNLVFVQADNMALCRCFHWCDRCARSILESATSSLSPTLYERRFVNMSSNTDVLAQSTTCLQTAGAALSSRSADTDTAQARISELEAQIEAMIEQMPSDQPQSSDRVAELESERAAAQSQIAELESQVEAMIEQIGSSADAAVVALEQDIVHLKKELRDAQRDTASTHAAAAEAVALLQEANKERDAFKMQVE